MSLRLFHITEFAQSMLSPAAQREARHPARLLLMAMIWLALAGNLPLWRELARLPMDASSLLWIGLCLASLAAAALGALFSLVNWPWLLRPVILLTIWIAACNTVLLWAGHSYLRAKGLSSGWRAVMTQLLAIPTWELLLAFGLLGLLPTVIVWRIRLRRVALLHRLPQNLLLLVSFALAMGLIWVASRSELLPLLQGQPRWLELLSPFNSLLSIRH